MIFNLVTHYSLAILLFLLALTLQTHYNSSSSSTSHSDGSAKTGISSNNNSVTPPLDSLSSVPSYSSLFNTTIKMSYTGEPGTKRERTFLAIKPDGVQRALIGEIIAKFERKGFKLVAMKFLVPTKDEAEKHYEEHRGKPFFNPLVSFFISGPLVAMVWEGLDVIAASRKIMGATKPQDSAVGTIRGDYAVHMGRNIIHGSDGVASAKREIEHWFKENEVFDWNPDLAKWLYE